MNTRQRDLLRHVGDATDLDTPLHRSGEVTSPGLCAWRTPTVRALLSRGYIESDGCAAMLDGDGYTAAENVPVWIITVAGRKALV